MKTLLIGLGIVVGLLLLAGLAVLARQWRVRRRRVLWEDALKQICSARHEGRALTPAEIAGRLGLSLDAMARLVQALEAEGLLVSRAGELELTESGEELGLRILRGHRLWERYLFSEGRLPLDRLHQAAERVEHHLAREDIDALADHLGHPRTDPHGDIVPSASGTFSAQRRTPLTDWPPGRLAVVVHVEDEPPESLKQALLAGLTPGTVLRIMTRDADSIVCETAAGRFALAPAVANSVDVRRASEGERMEEPVPTLAGLPLGKEAEILALSDGCTGLSRRRLLDLGFTEGARVRAALSNLGDEAHVYDIRDTKVALRKELAEQVLIRPIGASAHRPACGQGVRP